MRRMIGRDDIYAAVIERRKQRSSILGSLDCRVALDLRAKFLVAGFVKPEMMYAHLGRDAFFRSILSLKHVHFFF